MVGPVSVLSSAATTSLRRYLGAVGPRNERRETTVLTAANHSKAYSRNRLRPKAAVAPWAKITAASKLR